MAQTKRKRTRKHRGTPAGTIERAGRTGRTGRRARSAASRSRASGARTASTKPPTWQGAIKRAAIAAVVFGVSWC